MQNSTYTVSLEEIQSKIERITQYLHSVYDGIKFCTELDHHLINIRKGIMASVEYMIVLQNTTLQKYPDLIFMKYDDQTINESDQLRILNIELLHKNIHQMIILMDQCAIGCKFCLALGVRPYVKILAQAMCELITIKYDYIYPTHPELNPYPKNN